jgi:hypothetical protein
MFKVGDAPPEEVIKIYWEPTFGRKRDVPSTVWNNASRKFTFRPGERLDATETYEMAASRLSKHIRKEGPNPGGACVFCKKPITTRRNLKRHEEEVCTVPGSLNHSHNAECQAAALLSGVPCLGTAAPGSVLLSVRPETRKKQTVAKYRQTSRGSSEVSSSGSALTQGSFFGNSVAVDLLYVPVNYISTASVSMSTALRERITDLVINTSDARLPSEASASSGPTSFSNLFPSTSNFPYTCLN